MYVTLYIQFLFPTTDGNASAIGSLCDNYTTLLPTLIPISHWNRVGGVSEDGDHSFVSTLRVSLDDPVFDVRPSLLPQQLFLSYLDTLVRDTHTHCTLSGEGGGGGGREGGREEGRSRGGRE